VAVRQRLPKEESPQLDLLETAHYDYFCYVTTETLTPGKPIKNTVNAQLAKPGSKKPKGKWEWEK